MHAWSEVGCVWSSRQWASQVPHMKYYLDRWALNRDPTWLHCHVLEGR